MSNDNDDDFILEFFKYEEEYMAATAVSNLDSNMKHLETIEVVPLLGLQCIHVEKRFKDSTLLLRIDSMSDLEFFKYFRITRSTLNKVLYQFDQIEDNPFRNAHPSGKPSVCVRDSLFMTLLYLGSSRGYGEIAELFVHGVSAVHTCTRNIIKLLNIIAKSSIKWPSLCEMKKHEQDFKSLSKFPGVIGLIDECNIPIRVSYKCKTDIFLNSPKHFSTSNLIAACDPNGKFTYIFVACPWHFFDQKTVDLDLNLRLGYKNAKICQENYHLLGDSSFQLKTHIMVPFKGESLSTKQNTFNTKLVQTKSIIENSFQLLKRRFKRLQYIASNPDTVAPLVTAACVLHNFTLNSKEETDLLDKLIIEEGNEPIEVKSAELAGLHFQKGQETESNEEAQRKREKLANNLFSV